MRRRDRETHELARLLLRAGYEYEVVVARVRQTRDLDDRRARKVVAQALSATCSSPSPAAAESGSFGGLLDTGSWSGDRGWALDGAGGGSLGET